MLGIPASVEIEAVDISAAPAETRTGIRLVPVSIFDVQEGNSQHAATQHWVESGSAYQSTGNASYPGFPLARVVREGYIRSPTGHCSGVVSCAVSAENSPIALVLTPHGEHPFFQ